MKLNKSILILALEDSIAAHKKAGEQDYAWTIEQMEKNLDIIKRADIIQTNVREPKIRLFDGCYVQTADGLVHGPILKKDDTDVPFLAPPSLSRWLQEDGSMPGTKKEDWNTIVKVLNMDEV